MRLFRIPVPLGRGVCQIESTEPEDIQDIDGHLRGGPERALGDLKGHRQAFPSVRVPAVDPLPDP
ncbi:MAG: hypothetical protein HC921_22345 [Synechococcaceae cyanobacterium SM2_3_1]|nr:hypothetical protein [Synechococcaceae cyanobacterium SM2_3_1]